MKIAILGAGAIAFTTAALLKERGHEPIIWSPSGKRTVKLAAGESMVASGALSCSHKVGTADSAKQAVLGADAVYLAVDAPGHKPVLDTVAPHLVAGQPVIISAAYAMSGLHLSQAMKSRGIKLPIISWAATIGTAHQESLTDVNVRLIRPMIDMSVLGEKETRPGEGFELCRSLFGDRFKQCDSALEISLLANSNPVYHVPVTLLNLSRVERGEAWVTYEQTTPAVSRLVEALDAERVAIAAAFGFSIATVNQHFHRSFSVELGSMDAMMARLFQRGLKPKGAKSVKHRHLSQDLPWGLVFNSQVGKAAGVATPVHDTVIALASAALGRDQRAGQDSGFEKRSKEELLRTSIEGY
jgi:opine dehydrogenase